MANLTPHFTTTELRFDGAPADAQRNLRDLAELLEAVRSAVRVPLQVTSGYRSPARNAAVGGSDTSQHTKGEAADFVPSGISVAEFLNRFGDAVARGQMPDWGQLIAYPYTTGHLHISLPRLSKNRQVLIRTAEGGYSHIKLSSPVGVGLVLLALALFYLFIIKG